MARGRAGQARHTAEAAALSPRALSAPTTHQAVHTLPPRRRRRRSGRSMAWVAPAAADRRHALRERGACGVGSVKYRL